MAGPTIDKETYNQYAKPINYFFLIVFLCVFFVGVYKTYFTHHSISTIKGRVYEIKVEDGTDTIKMYYQYKVNDSLFHSIHFAIKDTLDTNLNTAGYYDVIYEIENPQKAILVVKK